MKRQDVIPLKRREVFTVKDCKGLRPADETNGRLENRPSDKRRQVVVIFAVDNKTTI